MDIPAIVKQYIIVIMLLICEIQKTKSRILFITKWAER